MVKILTPKEEMSFGRNLHRLLEYIFAADHKLGLTFLSKFDLADAYMHIRFLLNDIPSVAVLFPKDTDSETKLVGFCLLIPIDYV